MQDLILRQATVDDIEFIKVTEEQGFEEGTREDHMVYLQRIKIFPQGSFILEHSSAPVGCIFSEIWNPLESFLSSHFTLGHDISQRHCVNGSLLYISSMTILPQYRHNGFGGRLFSGFVNHISHKFPKIDSIVLLVNETWEHARKIYIGQGFKEVFVLKEFFKVGSGINQDGIIMLKDFSKINNIL